MKGPRCVFLVFFVVAFLSLYCIYQNVVGHCSSLSYSLSKLQLNRQRIDVGAKRDVSFIYKASSLEQTWLSHVGDSFWIDHPCDHLQREAEEWVSATRAMRWHQRTGDLQGLHPGIFSTFKERNSSVAHAIEPLAYILRNPTFPCGTYDVFSTEGNNALMDKDYLVLATSSMFPNRRKSYFFDVGCSIYKGAWNGQAMFGQAGQLWWLIEDYDRNGIQFDHIWGWEAVPVDPSIFWNNMPQKLKGRFTYWNFPASIEQDDLTNPVALLKNECDVADFCALKIDIDNGPVEWTWIQQILGDADVLARIDELFFEHHVNNGVMAQFWGGSFGQFETMALSYDIFSKLRAHGIRAHSWI